MDIELILSHKVQIPIGARRTEPYVFPWKECLDPVWSSRIPAGAGPPRRCGGGGHVSLTGSRSNSWVGTPAPATRGHGHQHRSVDTIYYLRYLRGGYLHSEPGHYGAYREHHRHQHDQHQDWLCTNDVCNPDLSWCNFTGSCCCGGMLQVAMQINDVSAYFLNDSMSLQFSL